MRIKKEIKRYNEHLVTERLKNSFYIKFKIINLVKEEKKYMVHA